MVSLRISCIVGYDRLSQELPKNYYKFSNGFLLVYDITNLKSFQSIDNWLKRIQENAYEDVPIILVGNKADLVSDRKVTKEQGQKKAD